MSHRRSSFAPIALALRGNHILIAAKSADLLALLPAPLFSRSIFSLDHQLHASRKKRLRRGASIMKTVLIAVLTLSLVSQSAVAIPTSGFPPNTEVVTVTFLPGSYNLRAGEEAKILWAIEGAREKGKIGSMAIASWSDRPHPSIGSLPKSDQDLARERILTLRTLLDREIGRFKYLKTHNMALNEDWVTSNLSLSVEKLNSADAANDLDRNAVEDLLIIRSSGSSSRAVVIIRVRQGD
jgi:hypothetical protein